MKIIRNAVLKGLSVWPLKVTGPLAPRKMGAAGIGQARRSTVVLALKGDRIEIPPREIALVLKTKVARAVGSRRMRVHVVFRRLVCRVVCWRGLVLGRDDSNYISFRTLTEVEQDVAAGILPVNSAVHVIVAVISRHEFPGPPSIENNVVVAKLIIFAEQHFPRRDGDVVLAVVQYVELCKETIPKVKMSCLTNIHAVGAVKESNAQWMSSGVVIRASRQAARPVTDTNVEALEWASCRNWTHQRRITLILGKTELGG